jgi:hypothetical protein
MWQKVQKKPFYLSADTAKSDIFELKKSNKQSSRGESESRKGGLMQHPLRSMALDFTSSRKISSPPKYH